MTELNTQLPTGGMLSGESKWEVRKTMLPGVWAVWGSTVRNFSTWRDAMDYADQQARTVEVVLPRGPYEIRSKQNIYEEPIKVEPSKHFPGHETVAVKYTAHGVPAWFFLAPDELRPLALALLALHYQQEVTQ